jgi:serine/threonine-protein kinase HipA
MEDMAQLTGTLTEYKYRSSIERVAKVIIAHSSVPGQDKFFYFLGTLHAFLTGNADMHLKNFALLENESGWRLAPAYDLVNTKLALPTDAEQFALPLRGKKNRLTRADLVDYLGLEVLALQPKVIENGLGKIQAGMAAWPGLISSSFLSREAKETYHQIVAERAAVLGLEY